MVKASTPAPSAELAKELIAANLEEITQQFVDAALGKGDFSGLDDKTRASMLVKAMEWGVGKPPPGKLPEDLREGGLVIE